MKREKMLGNLRSIAGLGLVLALLAQPARAVTWTWDSSGAATSASTVVDGSGTWSTAAANWWSGSGGADQVWSSANTAQFGVGAANTNPYTVTLGTPITAAGITFQNQAYSIIGSTLTLSSPTITVNASSGGTIGSIIAGNAGLTKTGSGALVLNGADSYTGTTTVSGGTLYVNNTNATNPITVNNKDFLGGSGALSSGTVTLNGNAGTIIAGFGGQGSLTMSGFAIGNTGTVDVANIIQYSSTAGATAAVNVTGNNGLNPEGSAGSILFYLSGPVPSGTGVIHLIKYSGSIQGVQGAAAFKSQPNDSQMAGVSTRTVLTVSSTYESNYIDLIYSIDHPVWTGLGTGASAGIWTTATQSPANWKSAATGAQTNFLPGDIVVFDDSAGASGGTTTVSISGTSSVNPASVTFNNNSYPYTLTGTNGITGGATLTKSGSGTLTITNSNSYFGGTTLNAGLLNISNSAALGGTSGLTFGTFSINGGTIANTGAGGMTMTLPAYPIAWNANFAFGGSNALNLGAGNVTLATSSLAVNVSGSTLTLGGSIGDNGNGFGFTQNGAGVLALTGSSTYLGPTAVNGGTLSVGNGGSGANLAGTSGVILAANTALVFNHADVQVFSPAVNGSGSLVHTGGGMTILTSSNNSYTGGTSVTGGTLQVGNAAALGGATGSIAVSTSGLLDMNGFSPAVGALTGSGVIDNVVAGGAPVLTIGNSDASATFSGTIRNTSGTLGLVKTGAGTETLSPGAPGNTFGGGTQINGGAVNVASSLALQNSTVNVAVNNGLVFSVSAATLGGLSGSGSVNLGPAALTVGGNNASSAYTGSLSGGSGLTKIGSGALDLTGTNSYAGPTVINGGTLQLGNFTPTVPNGNFANPNIAANSFIYTGSMSASQQAALIWTSGGNTAGAGAGLGGALINNSTAWGFARPYPSGSQAFSLQDNSTLSQSLYIPVAGTYTIAWSQAARPGYAANPYYFQLNGVDVGSVLSTSNTTWTTAISTFTVPTAGNYTIGFLGSTSGGTADQDLALNNIRISSGPSGGQLPSGTAVGISAGATLDLAGNNQTVGSLSGAGMVSNSNPTTLSILTAGGDNSSQTFSGTLQDGGGSLGLIVAGSGSLMLAGSNVYSGGTTVSGGTLQLGNGTTKNGSVAGDILNNSAILFANPSAQLYSGVISGSGSLTKNGAGTLQITGSYAYTGPTTINAGTVQLGMPVTVSGFGGTSLNISGSGTGWVVNTSGSANYTTTSNPINSNVLTLTDGHNNEDRSAWDATKVSPVLGFAASFAYNPNSGAADGMTFVLQSAGTGALGGGGGQFGYETSVTPSVGIVLNLYNNVSQTSYAINGASQNVLSNSNTGFFHTSSPLNVSVNYNAQTQLLSWTITNSSGTKFSDSQSAVNLQTILGASTAFIGFTGATGGANSTQTISNFTFTSAVNGNLPSTTALVISNSGALDLFADQTVGSLAGAGTVTNSFALATATLTTGGDGSSQTFSGRLLNGAGPLALTMAGPGNLTLTGSNTYSGPTTVESGALFAGAPGGLSRNSDFTVVGGTLDATAGPQTVHSIDVGVSGTLNLQIGHLLTSTGTAEFDNGSTLNLSGAVGSLPKTLMTYSGSPTGTFYAYYGGLSLAGSDFAYNSGSLELIHFAIPFFGAGIWAGTNASWSNSGNWTDVNGNSGVPGDGTRTPGTDTATFSGSSAIASITLDISPNLAALSFSTSNYTLNGGLLTMNSSTGTSSVTVTSGRHTINSGMFLSAGSLDVAITNRGVLNITGNISDDSRQESLIVDGDGSGRLILNGTNSYGGGTFVNAGTLVADSASALPDGSSLFVGQGASSDFTFAPALPADPEYGVPAISPAGMLAVPEPGTLALWLAAFGSAVIYYRFYRVPIVLDGWRKVFGLR
jgi:fibronectin-binding autotransporter adhesin